MCAAGRMGVALLLGWGEGRTVRIEERDSVKAQMNSQRGFGYVKNWSDSYGSGVRVAQSKSTSFSETNSFSPHNLSVATDLRSKEEAKGGMMSTNKMIPKKYTDAEIERRREQERARNRGASTSGVRNIYFTKNIGSVLTHVLLASTTSRRRRIRRCACFGHPLFHPVLIPIR